MSHYLIEQIAARPNIDVRTGTLGDRRRERGWAPAAPAHSRPRRRGDRSTLDACFVFIGASPRTDWLDGVLARDERGFILAGRDAQAAGWPLAREPYLLETTSPGVFVAGDVRARSIKRVASAVGEGSMAVSLIHEYLVERVSDADSPVHPRGAAHDRPVRRARRRASSPQWLAVARTLPRRAAAR